MHRSSTLTGRAGRAAASILALALTLTLASCTKNNQDAATIAPSTSSSAGPAPSESPPTVSSGSAPVSSSADTSVSSMAASAVPSTSIAPSSRSAQPSPTPKPSGTGVVGVFSTADASWFNSMCGGLSQDPRGRFAKLGGNLAAKKVAAAQLLTDQADRSDLAARTLKTLPAPAIQGGAALATAVISTFPKLATAARAGIGPIRAADSSAALQGAFDQALDAMNEATTPLDSFNDMMGAPAMVDQLKKVPTCAPLVN